jgi:hypothetical protein
MAAPTAANASNNIDVDSTGGTIYSGNDEGIVVSCKTGSAVSALVSVGGLGHGSNFYEIAAGAKEYFVRAGGLITVIAKGNSGTATISWAIVKGKP